MRAAWLPVLPVLLVMLGACGLPGGEQEEPPPPEPLAGVHQDDAPAMPIISADEAGDARLPWITVGDPDPAGLTVVVKAERPGWVHLRAGTSADRWQWQAGPVHTRDDHDDTASLTLSGMPPGARIYLQAVVQPENKVIPEPLGLSEAPGPEDGVAAAVVGLAPDPASEAPARVVVAGDLGGQGFCRPLDGGYAIFEAMRQVQPHLFVANGDLVYADGACPEVDPDGVPQRKGDFLAVSDPSLDWREAQALRPHFMGHWRYNQADPDLRRFLAQTPVVAQWDDHEVINDFGAPWDAWLTGEPERPGFPTLVAEGRRAFRAYSPVPVHPEEPERIYRSLRWGRHLELFVVDGRSYRSPNGLPDSPQVGKKLIGDTQRDWLVAALDASDATWKVVSVDVPLSTPTGSAAWERGRDGWANGTGDPSTPEGAVDRSEETGFELELHGLLWQLDQRNVVNVVFVTTDVHHSRSLVYQPDVDGDGDALVFHELISGPLRAWMGEPGELDPSFGPQSLYAEGGVPTFTVLRVQPQGGSAVLLASVMDGSGQVRPESELRLAPR